MVHVGGLKVEEVKEGRVVDGDCELRRGEGRGEGSKALGEGGVGEDAVITRLAQNSAQMVFRGPPPQAC